MAASTTSRRTDEDLLNRSLLDSIEAESLSERVEFRPPRDVASPQSFAYPLSPQSPQSINLLQYTDMYPNAHEEFQHRQVHVGRSAAPPYPNFSYEQHPTRSTTLPLSPGFLDQRYQGHMESLGLPRQFDHRVDSRDYIKTTHFPAPLYQAPVTASTNVHHHNHRDEEISTIFVVGFPDDMQVFAFYLPKFTLCSPAVIIGTRVSEHVHIFQRF